MKRMRLALSIRKKVSAVFILLVLLPAIAFGAFIASIDMRHKRQSAIAETRQFLHLMAQDIGTRASQVEHLMLMLSTEKSIRKILKYDAAAYGQYAADILYELEPKLGQMMAYLYKLNASIMLITPNERQPETYGLLMRESRFAPNAEIDKLKSGLYSCWGGVGWHMPPGIGDKNQYAYKTIPFYQKVTETSDDYLGVLKCSVRPEELFQVLSTWGGEDTVCVARGSEFIYGGLSAPRIDYLNEDDVFGAGDRIYVSVELPGMDMRLLAAIPSESAVDSLLAALPTVGVALMFAVVLYLMANMVLKRILVGFKDVNRAIQSVENDNHAIRLPEYGNDEIGRLFFAFNRLLEIREEQSAKLAEQERRMHTAQILALQCQMNPHFLFNALNWLQLSIETKRFDQRTSDAIAYLSGVLHYNMSALHISTVGDEIDNLNNYLSFMDAREPGAIEANIDCPEKLYSRPFLRFSLQPLVENAIRHGKISKKTLNVCVSFREESQSIILRVSNDGARVQDSQIVEINKWLSTGAPPATESLGLYNLARRLHLLYGSVRVAISNEDSLVVVEVAADDLAGEE